MISIIRSDSYATGFDEDVPSELTNQCPRCDGLITTNMIETVCEDCGLVIGDQRTTHRPELA
ncbi:TFIIB-type zinc ribbon-containing protein [Haladaptatus sp. DYF46]|uniref:TFIIB-type zinc ribbon-containing protein n=1 Tax=Haladaptatus sp. DYF46 TaxID=2886041 RepID=UPI0031842BDE